MQTGWLNKAGPYRVEHLQLEDAGPLLAEAHVVPRGVQHTTEGTTIEGALAAYKAKRCAPTFTIGRDLARKARIVQHVPLGNAARALVNAPGGVETNRACIAQIELVGISPIGRVWLPDLEVQRLLAAVYWQLRHSCGIPLQHVANTARTPRTWQEVPGWYGHVDLPENEHVDPRLLDYSALFSLARRLNAEPPRRPVKVKPKPRALAPGVAIMLLRARRAQPSPVHA